MSPSCRSRHDGARPLPALTFGRGDALVLMHGYALAPRTYTATAERLAEHVRVVVPEWLEVDGTWSPERVGASLEALLEQEDGRVTVAAHSFGGGLALGLASRRPDLVERLVIVDSIALSARWSLAREVLPGTIHLLRLATKRAAVDFTRSWLRHPIRLARAGWWGFQTDRSTQIRAVARSGVACHVLWAERDTLLSRESGRRFADELGATFTVVSDPEGGAIDHDWMFRHPKLFENALRDLEIL